MPKKKSILIVDDNPENIKILGTLLAKYNYEIGIAPDGYKALDFIKNIEPDLILLDIMMPGIDGFEVCRKLKKDIFTKHIPIIFLTAKINTEDIVKGFEAGGVDYITKPFNSAELLARVNTHIELKVLKGFLTICSKCKRVRDKNGNWHEMEQYIAKHSEILMSHGICEKCAEELYGNEDWFKNSKNRD